MVRLLVFLLTLFTSTAALAFAPHEDGTVNAVIGDVSWRLSTPGTEVQRIEAHLRHMHARLRRADVSHLDEHQRAARRWLLGELHDYIEAGAFPRRRY